MLYIPWPFKRCPRCSNDFPATSKHFYKNSHKRDGLKCRCKSCCNTAVAQWKRERPEWVARKDRKYRAKHADRIKEQRREYRAEHKEQIAKRDREYRAAHKEQAKERIKKWIAANPERYRKACADSDRRRYAANPERYREIKRRWRRANPD